MSLSKIRVTFVFFIYTGLGFPVDCFFFFGRLNNESLALLTPTADKEEAHARNQLHRANFFD